VVLVILDTVRADHLSCDGYGRETTPNLDRLASEGELYVNAWAQAPWTLPAVATILTGQPPRVHGAGRGREGLRGLRSEVPTVAELLSGAGYRTAAFFSVIFCGPRFGLGRGFGRYDFQTSDAGNRGQRKADVTTDAALGWLRGLGRGDPFFLVVHYFDPHLTYDPPPPWDTLFEPAEEGALAPGFGSASQVFDIREGRLELTPRQRESLIARYDGEIRFADEQFGRLRQGMETLGLWDRSLVVVVGDHGEELWDHGGFEHGHSHYRELLRVPLIVKGPGRTSGARRTERVSQLDIAPMILAAAALPVPPELPGRVLGSGGGAASEAEGSLWGGELLSIRDESGTLILDRTSGARRYFAPDDPLEERDRWPEGPAAARDLERALLARPSLEAPGDPVEPTHEELETLRSLGYVE
jgi:arylsulfatase A-like enzyme